MHGVLSSPVYLPVLQVCLKSTDEKWLASHLLIEWPGTALMCPNEPQFSSSTLMSVACVTFLILFYFAAFPLPLVANTPQININIYKINVKNHSIVYFQKLFKKSYNKNIINKNQQVILLHNIQCIDFNMSMASLKQIESSNTSHFFAN